MEQIPAVSTRWLTGVRWSIEDAAQVARDLGREPRGVVGVGARRSDGHPLVVVTSPRLPNGTPFPTTFYLTDPALTAACSRLEAEHFMDALSRRLEEDELFAAGHEAAHADYLERRQHVAGRVGSGEVPEIAGISAGGLPTRVKCLHALVGHSLVAGPGVDPAGDAALQEMRDRGLIEADFRAYSAEDLARAGLADPETGDSGSAESGENSERQAELQRVAAIDCGTNSIRLLIADVPVSIAQGAARDLIDIERDMVITRLGQGVDRTGFLSPGAIERTLAAAREYQQRIEDSGATRVRVAATSATRDAANRAEFTEGMAAITGANPEVITGNEEAALSFAGAVSALPDDLRGPFLVVDIGGGSTEFVLGTDYVEQSVSMNMGSVRVTERFGPEPWGPREKSAARRWIDSLLYEAEETVDFRVARTVVGVAGTVTSLAALVYGVQEYRPDVTHGSSPSAAQWAEALDFMINASVEQKDALPAMPAGRADVIGGGALVWERILVRLGVLDDETVAEGASGNAPEVTSGEADGVGFFADGFGRRDSSVGSSAVRSEPRVVVSEHDILDGLALSAAAGRPSGSVH